MLSGALFEHPVAYFGRVSGKKTEKKQSSDLFERKSDERGQKDSQTLINFHSGFDRFYVNCIFNAVCNTGRPYFGNDERTRKRRSSNKNDRKDGIK